MKGGKSLKTDDQSAAGEHWSPRQAGWPVIVLRLAGVVAVLMVAVVVGRHAGSDIKDLEHFVDRAGAWGPVVFIVAGVIFTSMMVPDTVFGVAAGVLFGLWWGTVLMVVMAFLTAL